MRARDNYAIGHATTLREARHHAASPVPTMQFYVCSRLRPCYGDFRLDAMTFHWPKCRVGTGERSSPKRVAVRRYNLRRARTSLYARAARDTLLDARHGQRDSGLLSSRVASHGRLAPVALLFRPFRARMADDISWLIYRFARPATFHKTLSRFALLFPHARWHDFRFDDGRPPVLLLSQRSLLPFRYARRNCRAGR